MSRAIRQEATRRAVVSAIRRLGDICLCRGPREWPKTRGHLRYGTSGTVFRLRITHYGSHRRTSRRNVRSESHRAERRDFPRLGNCRLARARLDSIRLPASSREGRGGREGGGRHIASHVDIKICERYWKQVSAWTLRMLMRAVAVARTNVLVRVI